MSDRGKRRVANNDRERCVALTVMTSWKKSRGLEQRCSFAATYVVEKKRLCRHHAVQEAMAIGMEKGWVKRREMPRLSYGRVITKETKL